MEQKVFLFLLFSFSSLLVKCEERRICDSNLRKRNSAVEITIPEDEVLYSGPGSAHKVKIKVRNLIEEEESVDLSVSHRENYFNSEDGGHHVELVDRIWPKKLPNLAFNETREIKIGFKIPSFVAIGRQGKVSATLFDIIQSIQGEK